MVKLPIFLQYILINSLQLCSYIILINCGANNLHHMDGTSTAEVINGDVFFEIVDPVELEYTYRIRPAKDFGAPFNESFHIKNVPLVPILPKNGCKPPDNLDDIEGNVALIERGDCSFKMKTLVAERAGARAVIISDIINSNQEFFIEMIDDNAVEDVNIPAGYLLGKNGLMILKTLERLKRNYALINLPINLTFIPVHEMIDDNAVEDVNIPAGYLLGKNGLMILKTLERLKRNYALINLPINLTFIPVHEMNQPPWLGW